MKKKKDVYGGLGDYKRILRYLEDLDIPMSKRYNAVYTTRDMSRVLLTAAKYRQCIHTVVRELRHQKDGRRIPTSETVLDKFKDIDPGHVEERGDKWIADSLRCGNKVGMANNIEVVAIDETDVPYYGEEGLWVIDQNFSKPANSVAGIGAILTSL